MDLAFSRLEQQAEAEGFSGAIRVQHCGETIVEFARGYGDRANQRPNDLATRFAVASGTKAFTALTIMSLVESGDLTLDTTVQSVVPGELPPTSTTTSSVRSRPTPSNAHATICRS